jgi:hypothetical protein
VCVRVIRWVCECACECVLVFVYVEEEVVVAVQNPRLFAPFNNSESYKFTPR